MFIKSKRDKNSNNKLMQLNYEDKIFELKSYHLSSQGRGIDGVHAVLPDPDVRHVHDSRGLLGSHRPLPRLLAGARVQVGGQQRPQAHRLAPQHHLPAAGL